MKNEGHSFHILNNFRFFSLFIFNFSFKIFFPTFVPANYQLLLNPPGPEGSKGRWLSGEFAIFFDLISICIHNHEIFY